MYLKFDGAPIAESASATGIQSWTNLTNTTIVGSALNDVLSGAGTDVLVGGLGDDWYYFNGGGDSVVENPGEGIDSVTTWASYTLAANVENLTVSGSSGLYAAGNDLDNLIKVGDDQAQTLYGGKGNDVLVGGLGTDTFVINAGDGNDAIYGWHSGDKVRLTGSTTLHTFADVQAAMTQQGSDVVVQNGANAFVVRNASVSQFTAADFQLGLDISKLGALTFGDEFNSLSLRSSANPTGTWSTDYGYGGLGSYTLSGNGELQVYVAPGFTGSTTKDLGLNPFSITNGVLDIHAQKVDAALSSQIWNYGYTSGVITTKQSFAQTYGYFEMKAALPSNGGGAWPAFWLVPADGSWPPELDVMEQLSGDANVIYTTQHSAASGTHTAVGASDFIANSSGFHTYGVLWTPTVLAWYVDGVEVFETATPTDMNKPMYMIANMAVGGWAGTPGWTSADMQIDYIHAYAINGSTTNTTTTGTTPPPPATIAPNTLFTLPVSATPTNTVTTADRFNTLSGGSGADLLDGHGVYHALAGAGGDDTYVVYLSTDTITERPNAGVDTVLSKAASYTLGSNVENLSLTGTGHQTGVGNSGSNILTANAFGSVLSGGGGNDILVSGGGGDTLTGGAGKDIFQFNKLPGIAAEITDFTAGTDMLDLRVLFQTAGYKGVDPIADHVLSFSSTSTGATQAWFDADGTGSAPGVLVAILDHVAPASLHMQTDWAFA